MQTDAYEIYIDLHPVEPEATDEDRPWTLSGALASRGAPSVGETVPLTGRNQQSPPNRLRRRRTLFDRFLDRDS